MRHINMNRFYRTIKLSPKKHTTWITLNRPDKLNAINTTMLQELTEAIDSLEKDQNVRYIVINGQGDRAFSAGADITELMKITSDNATKFSVKGQKVFSKLETMSKPVIAAISGYTLGGGLELALACDFRIAADNVKLGCPEITLGFLPAWGGTQRLPLIVGNSEAKRLIMFGIQIHADEAYKMGLVDKVVPLKNLEAETEAFGYKLTEYTPSALKHAKQTVNFVNRVSNEGLKKETMAFVQQFSSKQTREKIELFWSQRNKK
jgi:enoyl-CoA hydratase/carnithine racemase